MLAMKSRSRRSYNDLSPMIVIAGRRLRSRRDSEKYYPRSQGQDGDRDRGEDRAILAKLWRSQRNDRDRRKMIAIAKTDSFYFSSMILNAMQLMGWCDFEK